MKHFKWLAVTGCLLIGAAGTTRAQDKTTTPTPPAAADKAPAPNPPPAADKQPPPQFKTQPIDPAYTGLQAAIKLVEKNEVAQKAVQPNATLSDKQAALNDKDVAKALEDLNFWLGQNTAPTQEINYTMAGPDGFFVAALGGVGQLAHLLEVRQYVMLSEGRVTEAINATREALRLAVAIQNHGLIGCTVGFQVEDIVTLPFARHLDQLSVSDCDRVINLALDWDRSPNAIIFAMERERRGGILMMQRLAGDEGNQLRKMLANLPANAVKPDSDEAKMISQIRSLDNKGWKDLTVHMASGVDKTYAQAEQELQTPYWKRPAPAVTAPPSPKDLLANTEAFLTSALAPQLRKLEADYIKRQAYARLLGAHAAIHRFQWENNRLPGTLKELNIGSLAIDPFTGNDLIYKVDKETYTLESAGAIVYGKDGKPDPASRKTVTLTPTEPPAPTFPLPAAP